MKAKQIEKQTGSWITAELYRRADGVAVWRVLVNGTVQADDIESDHDAEWIARSLADLITKETA